METMGLREQCIHACNLQGSVTKKHGVLVDDGKYGGREGIHGKANVAKSQL